MITEHKVGNKVEVIMKSAYHSEWNGVGEIISINSSGEFFDVKLITGKKAGKGGSFHAGEIWPYKGGIYEVGDIVKVYKSPYSMWNGKGEVINVKGSTIEVKMSSGKKYGVAGVFKAEVLSLLKKKKVEEPEVEVKTEKPQIGDTVTVFDSMSWDGEGVLQSIMSNSAGVDLYTVELTSGKMAGCMGTFSHFKVKLLEKFNNQFSIGDLVSVSTFGWKGEAEVTEVHHDTAVGIYYTVKMTSGGMKGYDNTFFPDKLTKLDKKGDTYTEKIQNIKKLSWKDLVEAEKGKNSNPFMAAEVTTDEHSKFKYGDEVVVIDSSYWSGTGVIKEVHKYSSLVGQSYSIKFISGPNKGMIGGFSDNQLELKSSFASPPKSGSEPKFYKGDMVSVPYKVSSHWYGVGEIVSVPTENVLTGFGTGAHYEVKMKSGIQNGYIGSFSEEDLEPYPVKDKVKKVIKTNSIKFIPDKVNVDSAKLWSDDSSYTITATDTAQAATKITKVDTGIETATKILKDTVTALKMESVETDNTGEFAGIAKAIQMLETKMKNMKESNGKS